MISKSYFEFISRNGSRKINSSFLNYLQKSSSFSYSTSTNLKADDIAKPLENNQQSNELKSLLNKTKTIVNPLKHEDFFELNKLVNLEELFKARCHYGHDVGLRCPWMNEYIFGTRVRTDIINLDKTVPMLKKALNFLAHVAFRKGVILFITRYSQHIPLVERTAVEAGEYSNCKLWKNGSFTDSTRRFGSVIRLPDLCIFLHTHEKLNETHAALNESSKMLIPNIAICDTDIDPSTITYPIPGNDDSITSVQLYCDLFKKAILAGKKKRIELESKNVTIEFEPV